MVTFAKREGIAVESRWALALVTSWQIFANGVYAASRLVPELHALVDIPTLAALVIPGVPPLTNANAASNELVLDALLPGRTGGARPANVGRLRLLATTAVRIARGTARALAGERSRLVVADRPLGARIDRALVYVPATALHPRLPRVTAPAEARGHVVGQHAVGIRPARQILARI